REVGKTDELWRAEIGDAPDALAATSTALFAAGETTLHRVSPVSGELEWSVPHGGAGAATALTATRSTVYLGLVDGTVVAFEPEDGTMRWRASIEGTPVAPTVLADGRLYLATEEGDLVAIDAYEGLIHRDPPEAVLEQFRLAREAHRGERERVAAAPALTADGVQVELLANVNILHDVEVATRVGATGIGLYRSEFPFLVRNDFPSEAEQYRIYQRITERMGDGPIVLRTLDVGGDKLFSESQYGGGNPFLGLRGIRFSLAHPELFDEQLRAMLRAGAERDLRILFPMISSLDEFRLARNHVDAVLADLADEGLPHHSSPRLGIMVELPSAIECADDLAAEVDFLSIGSNDLVMYLLAVDRANEQVEALYEPYHPAVLRSLARVIAAALRHDTPVSICGEAGGDPTMIRFLIGCGLRSISADPARLPGIRATVSAVSSTEAEDYARRLAAASTIDAVAAFISEHQ
ncbi:MAG: putative PEP-binding protein, partial [Spirochaetota bacterium]